METLSHTSVGWLVHGTTTWTREENTLFENALAYFDEKTPNRWFKVASLIPGKSVSDVMNQYRVLELDVSDIEAGLVPFPGYLASSFTLELANYRSFDLYRKRSRTGDHERKKGVPWTEDEHRRFLLGLEKHGKGDWRSISRNYVISKTPTQVASHAQKYYQRQLSGGKDRKRPSIHDITIINPSDPGVIEKPHLVSENNRPLKNHMSKVEMGWDQNGEGGFMVLNSDAYPNDFDVSRAGSGFMGGE